MIRLLFQQHAENRADRLFFKEQTRIGRYVPGKGWTNHNLHWNPSPSQIQNLVGEEVWEILTKEDPTLFT